MQLLKRLLSIPSFSKMLGSQNFNLAKAEVLISKSEIFKIKENFVNCTGDGPLGHPSIYINLVFTLLNLGKQKNKFMHVLWEKIQKWRSLNPSDLIY